MGLQWLRWLVHLRVCLQKVNIGRNVNREGGKDTGQKHSLSPTVRGHLSGRAGSQGRDWENGDFQL